VGIPLAPSKTPTVKQQQQAAAARKAPPAAAGADAALHSQHSIDEALHDLHDLNLSPQPGDSSGISVSSSSNGLAADAAVRRGSKAGGGGGAVAWRPLEDYCMEADLAK
jgi:hypothetical protein